MFVSLLFLCNNRVFYTKPTYSVNGQKDEKPGLVPLLETSIELRIPNVELKPSLDEIQSAVNECAR